MKARNKWNGNMYLVVSDTVKDVTLEREDGSRFTISKSEYRFSYIELK